MRDRTIIAACVWVVALTINLLPHSQICLAQTRPAVDALIVDLGSPQAPVREQAAAGILRIGTAARSSLRDATGHSLPEVSSRARELLGKLPFHLPTDSTDVKACLFGYEHEDESGRRQRIERLCTIPTPDASQALVRIVMDEPVDSLRWESLAALSRCDDPLVLAEVMNLRPSSEPVRLVLSAVAWRNADPEKCAKLLRRAVANSTSDNVEMAELIVPMFRAMTLPDDARAAFDAGYRILHPPASGPSPTAADLHRLADYLLRCNEQLPNALDLASRAAAADPENPALLNTLAEAHYRLGQKPEAIQIQQRAADLCPHDANTTARLERFLAAIE